MSRSTKPLEIVTGNGPPPPAFSSPILKDVPVQRRSQRHQPSRDSHVANNDTTPGSAFMVRVGGSGVIQSFSAIRGWDPRPPKLHRHPWLH